jgi:hypothetical protein
VVKSGIAIMSLYPVEMSEAKQNTHIIRSSWCMLVMVIPTHTDVIKISIPFAALDMLSSSVYVLSCMSQPKITEQKPNPDSRIERNLDLAITLPRKIPSRSTPATLTRTSFSSRAVNCSTLLAKVEPGAVISGDDTGEPSDSEEVDGAGELFVETVYIMPRR